MSFAGGRVDRGALRGPAPPQLLESAGAEPAVLAFHGFGGTPLEVAKVVEAAAAVGLRSQAPMLPGHGTHARELAPFGFAAWYGAARAALATAAPHSPAIAAGFSMGSLLALQLALEDPRRVAALILISNALWLAAPYPAWPMQWARYLHVPDLLIPKPSSDLADPDGHAHHATYTAQPLHAALEVLRAGEALRPRLRELRCPVLILHGAQDRVCPLRNAWRAAEQLGSTDIKVVVFPRSRHILNWDFDREQLRAELTGFLRRWAAPAAADHTPVDP